MALQLLLLVAFLIAFYGLWAVVWKIFYATFVTVGKVVQATFKDGRKMHVVSGDLSAGLIYKEIFLDRVYFKYGISLDHCKEPLIMDIGGHCGMFSTFVAEVYPGACIHVFEPVPALVEAIHKNLAGLPDARVKVHKMALGESEAEVSFQYNPRMSANTSLFANQAAPSSVSIVGLVRALYHDAVTVGHLPQQPTLTLCWLLELPVIRYVAFFAFLPFLLLHILQELAASKSIPVRTRVASLSQILREQGLSGKRIDLLKIDVEGAEWMVLMGLGDTWDCIDQAVIEVHNCDEGRVQKVMELLRSKGFNVLKDPPELEIQKILDLHTIFASRKILLQDGGS